MIRNLKDIHVHLIIVNKVKIVHKLVIYGLTKATFDPRSHNYSILPDKKT
jgi:hypothetical protein